MQSGGVGLPNRTVVHMPCLSVLGELRSFSRVDGEAESRKSESSTTDSLFKFDQSMQQHKKKNSAVIDQESLRVRVCITVTAGILTVQVHIEVADSRHPGAIAPSNNRKKSPSGFV